MPLTPEREREMEMDLDAGLIGNTDIRQPVDQTQPQGYQESQPWTRAIGNSPLGKIFDIPVLGGILRNAASSSEAYGRGVLGAGYELGRAGLSGLGNKDVYVNQETGQTNQNPFLSEEDLTKMSSPAEMVGRTVNFGLTAAGGKNPLATIKSLPHLAKAPFNPIEALGKLRAYFLGSKTVPSTIGTDLKKNLMEGEYYKFAPASTRTGARSQMLNFLTESAPLTAKGKEPGLPLLKELYKNLIPFEKGGRAYAGSQGGTALSQGTTQASHVIRDYLKQNSPLSAKLLTNLMSGLKASTPLAKKAGLGLGAGGGLLWLLSNLFKNPGGSNYGTR